MKALLICLVLWSGCGWSNSERGLQTAFTVTMIADWRQTRSIVKECAESNPLLGTCGENIPVDFYFPVTLILQTVLVHYLPQKYRPLVQGLSIGIEATTVVNNFQDGEKLF